jgi:hypothetical protein
MSKLACFRRQGRIGNYSDSSLLLRAALRSLLGKTNFALNEAKTAHFHKGERFPRLRITTGLSSGLS